MPDAATTTDKPIPTAPAKEPVVDASKDGEDGRGSKAAVLADLATERDKRQELEKQVQELTKTAQSQKTLTDALGKAFGVGADETSDVARLAEQVTSLKDEFAKTQHQNVVLSVANEHGISDKDDLALLADAKDEEAVRRLAARIAKASEGPNKPKPDLTQGGRGASGQGGTPADDFANFLKQSLG